MGEIYQDLTCLIHDDMSVKQLHQIRVNSEGAADGIMAGIQAIGELAFWAGSNPNYSDEQAKDALTGIGHALIYLPRITEALLFNADEATTAIKRKEKKNA